MVAGAGARAAEAVAVRRQAGLRGEQAALVAPRAEERGGRGAKLMLVVVVMVTGDSLGGGRWGALLLEQSHPGRGSGGAPPQLGAQLPLLDLPRQNVRHRAKVVRRVNN